MKNALNLVANLIAFAVSFGISFFLSPYIVNSIGIEANGLVGVANSLMSYSWIFTIIVSAPTDRFITVKLRSGEYGVADEYYTASYFGNLILAGLLAIPMSVGVFRFGDLFDVPPDLLFDAQLLTASLFLSVLVSLLVPAWRVGTFATNNLHLDSIRGTQSVVLRGALILILFTFLRPNIGYIGIASLSASLYIIGYNLIYKRRLLPMLTVSIGRLHWNRLRELFAAGLWNSLNYCGGLLATGFSLLLASLFLGTGASGMLGLAMTVPSMVLQLSVSLSNVSLPSLAYAFSERKYHVMRGQTKRALCLVGLVAVMPLAGVVVFGRTFFALWVPSEDPGHLWLVSMAASLGLGLIAFSQPLQNIFVITNSQRRHSVGAFVMGVSNVLLAICLLTKTDFGVFGILAATALTVLVRILCFTVPMSAVRIGCPRGVFLPDLSRSVGFLGVLVAVGFSILKVHEPNNWVSFFGCVVGMSLVGSLVNLFVLTPRAERAVVLSVMRRGAMIVLSRFGVSDRRDPSDSQ